MDNKYLVFESKLLELFDRCPDCQAHTASSMTVTGTLLTIQQVCGQCGFSRKWNSQPFVNQMPAGNLLLSGAILFSGSQPAKCLQLLRMLRVACISRATFFRHQRQYLTPTVLSTWHEEQEQLFRQLGNLDGGLILTGDAHSDSPGHCAK